MEYVYHMVPKNMVGQRLMPLNALKEREPELYAEAARKYFDHPERPKLLKQTIPKLDCLWNDVLHFLPLHPSHVYEGLKSLDIRAKTDLLFYEIPVERLSPNRNAVYHYRKEHYRGPAAPIDPAEIGELDPEKFDAPATLPADTLAYFREEHEKGNRFGMFAYIPHVLSFGEVDVADVKIVNWSKQGE